MRNNGTRNRWHINPRNKLLYSYYIMRHSFLICLITLLGMGSAHAESIPVQTIVLEAENQGFEGMEAVGEVIRNRAKERRQSVEAVCLTSKQFSAWNQAEKAQRRLSGVSEATLEVANRAWQASKVANKTRGATFYHTTTSHPYWAKGKRPCAVIGDHVFYNNVK